MVWHPAVYGQAPCNVFEVPKYPMPPAAPCPNGADSIQTIFLIDPVMGLYTYCDQGLVTDDPNLHVLEFMQAYLNACAREALSERCYYTGDFFSYGFDYRIRDRTGKRTFYSILYTGSGSGQTDHRFDQNYKDFVYTANHWKQNAPSGGCPFGFNSEWLIDAFELQENPGTGNVELRVTYKRVCCNPNIGDDPIGPGPSNP